MSVVNEGSIDPKEELQLGVAEAPTRELIQLKEEQVFTQIGERGEQREHQWWVLDTRATNHMTGTRSTFSKLDSRIHGTSSATAPSSRSKGAAPSCSTARAASTASWTTSTLSRGSRLILWAWVNSIRSTATSTSSSGCSRSATIDDGSHASSAQGESPLHPRVEDRTTGQPLSQDQRSSLEVARKVRALELSCFTETTQVEDGVWFASNRRRE